MWFGEKRLTKSKIEISGYLLLLEDGSTSDRSWVFWLVNIASTNMFSLLEQDCAILYFNFFMENSSFVFHYHLILGTSVSAVSRTHWCFLSFHWVTLWFLRFLRISLQRVYWEYVTIKTSKHSSHWRCQSLSRPHQIFTLNSPPNIHACCMVQGKVKKRFQVTKLNQITNKFLRILRDFEWKSILAKDNYRLMTFYSNDLQAYFKHLQAQPLT